MAKYTINFAGCSTIATAQTHKTAMKKALGLLMDKVSTEYKIDIEHNNTFSVLYAYNEKTTQGEMVLVYGQA